MGYENEPVKGFLSQVSREEFNDICDQLIEHDSIDEVEVHEGGCTYSEFKINGTWWFIGCTNSVINEDPAIFTDCIRTADEEPIEKILEDLGARDKVYGPINMVWTV